MKKSFFSEIKKFDFTIPLLALLLSIFGIFIISSATKNGVHGIEGEIFVYKQIIWVGFSFLVFIVLSFYDARKLKNFNLIFYLVNLFLLGIVFFIGSQKLGAQRWIDFGPVSFQPSESAKLLLLLFYSAYFSSITGKDISWKNIGLAFVYLIPPILLILLQPDLGTGAVIIVILMGIMLGAGVKVRDIAIIILVFSLIFAGAVKFHVLEDYQIKRLTVFLSPESDPSAAGYNLTQAKIAIGSGGLTGKGYYSGTQSSLRFIPERHTDFVFSVIGEELGFLGSMVLLVLYLLLLLRIMYVTYTLRSKFLRLFCIGYSAFLLFHIFTNVGMNMGIMPITGIPLPFISYGGSFLLVNIICLAIIESAWRFRFSS